MLKSITFDFFHPGKQIQWKCYNRIKMIALVVKDEMKSVSLVSESLGIRRWIAELALFWRLCFDLNILKSTKTGYQMIWILHRVWRIACKLFSGTVLLYEHVDMPYTTVCSKFPLWLKGQMRNTKCIYTICISSSSVWKVDAL